MNTKQEQINSLSTVALNRKPNKLPPYASKEIRSIVNNYESSYLHEPEYKIKFPLKNNQLINSYKLREQVFCKELNWAQSTKELLEIDEFDKNSQHLGVTDKHDNLLGTLRFTPSQHEWLMEKYFEDLLPLDFRYLKNRNSAEVTRMAIDSDSRAICVIDGRSIADLLYKGIYDYCKLNKLTRVYIVVSTSVLRHLKIRRMPVKSIGKSKVMPDGVKAVAAVIDWEVLMNSDNTKDKRFLKWLNKPTPSHNELLWPQLASDLSH